MNSFPDKVSCSKLELNPDGSKSWSQPEIGYLRISEVELLFENRKIPFSHIENAVLNEEKLMLIHKHYSLLIETELESYLFNLGESEYWDQLPFPFQKTEGETHSLTILVRAAIVLLGLMILLKLVKIIL